MNQKKENRNKPIIAEYEDLVINGRKISLLKPLNGSHGAITFVEVANAYHLPYDFVLSCFELIFGQSYELQIYQVSNYQFVQGLSIDEFDALMRGILIVMKM